jgi:hypothetical protein
MSQYSPELGGMSGPSGFAPADFDDVAAQPLGAMFDLGGHGSNTPYLNAVNSIVHKATDEARGRAAALSNLPTGWKRRLRDFINVKNNELLDFLKLSVPSHAVLGPGEILLRRFGNPQVMPNHPSVRDMVMDISGAGETVLADLNALLKRTGDDDTLTTYANQTRIIYEEYRTAGDDVLLQQNLLKAKLDKLDRIQQRVTGLLEIDPSEKYEALMEASEAYLKKIFEDNKIEEEYNKLLAAYRRFITLRDVVSMSRALMAYESEPLCSICLSETVSYALSPCGHTLCNTCVKRQNGQCFMCRNPIKEKVKIFFS